MTEGIAPKLLNSRDAAKMLAISERTLWSLTAPRGPLPAVRIGSSVRFDVKDLDTYIEAQKKGSLA